MPFSRPQFLFYFTKVVDRYIASAFEVFVFNRNGFVVKNYLFAIITFYLFRCVCYFGLNVSDLKL